MVNSVVWLHILIGPFVCVCVAAYINRSFCVCVCVCVAAYINRSFCVCVCVYVHCSAIGDDYCTETCRSCFNVHFNIVFKVILL